MEPTTTPPQMIILQGISGAGKSEAAYLISQAIGATIYSTDDFFMDREGNYAFDGRKLPEYHSKNLCAAIKHMGDYKIPKPLIIDNTNTTLWEVQPYLEAARLAGFTPSILRIEAPIDIAFARCAHNVPLSTIQDQASRLEKFPTEWPSIPVKAYEFPCKDDKEE